MRHRRQSIVPEVHQKTGARGLHGAVSYTDVYKGRAHKPTVHLARLGADVGGVEGTDQQHFLGPLYTRSGEQYDALIYRETELNFKHARTSTRFIDCPSSRQYP